MKQLNTYINEALIKKDTKLDISEYLIFIPWNNDYTRFNNSEYQNKFDYIQVIQNSNSYQHDWCWIINSNEIEKIKQYINDSKTKLYYIPAKYSKDEFIKDCENNKISIEDIRKYTEYEITK